jgi:hypothetical protein
MLAGRSIGLFVGIFTMTGECKHIGTPILRLLATSEFCCKFEEERKKVMITNGEQVSIWRVSITVCHTAETDNAGVELWLYGHCRRDNSFGIVTRPRVGRPGVNPR